MALLVLWASAIAVIATVDLVTFATASGPGARLLESRYLGPIGYANGTAALGAMAFWPLLAVAAGRRFAAAARIVALPAACVVLALGAAAAEPRNDARRRSRSCRCSSRCRRSARVC